jgi:acyl-CoA synthetase (AMP-forming)/AMP-acid ligase II
VARVDRHRDVVDRSRLRVIRSCSAALPPVTREALEAAFRAPVVEAYGMTEAAHQMTSTPLPVDPAKAGSVGVSTGTAVAILDATGEPLATGQVGEIAVRGPSVTAGYEGAPAANAQAFVNGWFRTGDEGRLDEDGFLFITGRLKEIINRGGEKVSPPEVDQELLAHPAVAQAFAFSMPDPRLGETVAAVVVLKPGAACT